MNLVWEVPMQVNIAKCISETGRPPSIKCQYFDQASLPFTYEILTKDAQNNNGSRDSLMQATNVIRDAVFWLEDLDRRFNYAYEGCTRAHECSTQKSEQFGGRSHIVLSVI
jgi:hypothetical protein